MKNFRIIASLITFLLACPAFGCELNDSRSFESAIADSKNVFIVRVISTAVTDPGSGAPLMESAAAKVRVVTTFLGNTSISHINYNISWCGGTQLAAGHYYLIATNSSAKTLVLSSDSQFGIIDISRSYGLYSTKNPMNFDLLKKAIDARPNKLKDGSLRPLGQTLEGP